MEKHCRWIYLDNFHLISVYKAITIDNKSSRMCPKKTGSEYFFHLKKLCVFHQNHLSPSSHEEETDAEQQQKTIRRASIFLLRLSHFFFSHYLFVSSHSHIVPLFPYKVCYGCVCLCARVEHAEWERTKKPYEWLRLQWMPYIYCCELGS